MVLTFVIEDPLATDYGRNSSSPEAPLGHTVSGGVRQRRWAPRARTGCLTCRQVYFLVTRQDLFVGAAPQAVSCVDGMYSQT
ncbi:hypothetical protein LLEC1_03078 [Akanthomyces lecanii]|uniref:Uncharacterized protein n=1 Tax=Cordyceps confragosa TaxID=2714763 RepID=A0A179I355_CORDF|nr:hypothetical protein LLEC1_03078 [Akanthomyces lecanii]